MAMLLMGASQRHEQAVTMVPCVKILVRVTSGLKTDRQEKASPQGILDCGLHASSLDRI